MTHSLRFTLLGASLAAAGCVPLQQAPLVYSSKVTVGVDVSANVSENQGASVNIGVKTLDSAYVPVAVSKEIDKNSKDTAEKTLGLEKIEARYGSGSSQSESADPAAAAERNRKIDTYFSARDAADKAANEQREREKQVSTLGNLVTRLKTLRSGIDTAQKTPEAAAPTSSGQPQPVTRAQAIEQRAAEVAKLNEEGAVRITPLTSSNVDQVLADLDEVIQSTESAKTLHEGQLPQFKARAETTAADAERAKAEAVKVTGLSNTAKSDAMSVYGRFDSNASGQGDKGAAAGLLVGKIFSTGLASQNLTEAVMIEAGGRCVASAFETLREIKDPAQRQQILDSLATVCAPQQKTGRQGNGQTQ